MLFLYNIIVNRMIIQSRHTIIASGYNNETLFLQGTKQGANVQLLKYMTIKQCLKA